jgi:hypothetical protein
VGPGVWVQSKINLNRYAGRHIQYRFITSALDDGLNIFISYIENYSGTGSPSIPLNQDIDDGWYIDDVTITNTVPLEIQLQLDTTPGGPIATLCPAAGASKCDTATPRINATPSVSLVPGGEVVLTGLASTLNRCAGGALQYQWRQGSTILQSFSSDPDIVQAPARDTTYTLDIRCSTDPATTAACSRSLDVTVPVYDGGTSQSMGLSISGNAASTLRWNLVAQNSAAQGYSIFRGSLPLVDANRDGLADSYGAPFPVTVNGTSQASSCGLTASISQVVEQSAPTVPAGGGFFYLAGHDLVSTSTTPLGLTSAGRLRTSTTCP